MTYQKIYWRKKRGNKYQAKGRYYDGKWFDSTFELNVYQDLLWDQKAGNISKIERQVKIPLEVNGIRITNYYVDFRVTYPDGSVEYIEAKGFETQDWRIKWNLFMAILDQIDPGAKASVYKQSQSKKLA